MDADGIRRVLETWRWRGRGIAASAALDGCRKHVAELYVERDIARADAVALLARVEELEAEVARLHERLEDNREFRINPDDPEGALIRHDVEPGSIPDGISCRDETIKLLDESIAELEEKGDRQEEALLRILQWADAYPEDMFTPLSKDEERACVQAMEQAVSAGSSRMHASWGRHILKGVGDIARAALREKPPE